VGLVQPPLILSWSLIMRTSRSAWLFVLSRCRDNTNNAGERDLRPVKLHENVSLLWRTTAAAKAWCRTRSYISTLRKNNQPVLQGLRDAITGTPWTPAATGS